MSAALTGGGHRHQYVEVQFSGMVYNVELGKRIFPVFTAGSSRYLPGTLISVTGHHVGVHVMDTNMVFCNVHPNGIPVASWFYNFYGVGQTRQNAGDEMLGPERMLGIIR